MPCSGGGGVVERDVRKPPGYASRSASKASVCRGTGWKITPTCSTACVRPAGRDDWRSGPLARRRSCQIGGDNAQKDDAIECSGPANASHADSTLLDLLEVQQVSADERPNDTRDIGDRRRFTWRK